MARIIGSDWQPPPGLEEKLQRSRVLLRAGYPWWLRPWLARNVVAITLGRRIYVLPRFLQKPSAEVTRLIRHELAHVQQVERHGLIGFLVRYLAEFFRHLRRERSIDAAYRKISFEIEALAAEEGADDL